MHWKVTMKRFLKGVWRCCVWKERMGVFRWRRLSSLLFRSFLLLGMFMSSLSSLGFGSLCLLGYLYLVIFFRFYRFNLAVFFTCLVFLWLYLVTTICKWSFRVYVVSLSSAIRFYARRLFSISLTFVLLTPLFIPSYLSYLCFKVFLYSFLSYSFFFFSLLNLASLFSLSFLSLFVSSLFFLFFPDY